MVNVVKRHWKKIIIIVIIILIFCLNIKSCTLIYSLEIKYDSKRWIRCFENEDVDGLYKFFAKDIREKYPEKMKNEIKKAYEVIEGEIVSYTYKGEIGSEYSKDYYKMNYYYSYPEYIVKTSTGNEYKICFKYCHVIEVPDYEGIGRIYVTELRDGDRYDKIIIGKDYDYQKISYSYRD